MKYNKGFAPLILAAIIVGALVIGGGAYYIGKSKGEDKKVGEKLNVENQEVDNKKVEKVSDNSNLEESSSEVFKNQPGAIKSIEYDGAEFLVDLLTNNPNWIPGGSEEFFLNQNSKIRRLNVNNATIVKNCATQYKDSSYASGFKSDLLSFTTYVQDKINKAKTDPGLVGHFGYTAYFDITGPNITAIYEQCLP